MKARIALALLVCVVAVAPVSAGAAPITETELTKLWNPDSPQGAPLGDWIAAGPGGQVWVNARNGSASRVINVTATPPTNIRCVVIEDSCSFGQITFVGGVLWSLTTTPKTTQAAHAPPVIGSFGVAFTIAQNLADDDLPFSLAADSTGALWLAEAQGVLARFDPAAPADAPAAQRFAEFPLPVLSAGPMLITQGPDNAMWFTQTASNTIGRVATGGSEPVGAITQFTIPTQRAGLYGITAGPDGAVWFAESRTGKIGRITTGGAVTEFQIPIKNAAPRNLVAGADGAIWFTDPGTNSVGRITVEGVVTEYVMPVARSSPNAITSSTDGRIWFTEIGDGIKPGKVASLDPRSPPQTAVSARARRTGAWTPATRRAAREQAAAAAKKKAAAKRKAAAKKKAAAKQKAKRG